LQIQRNGGQAGFDQSTKIAARIRHVATLRQPLTEQPTHRQLEHGEQKKSRIQGQDREMAMPDPLDAVRRDGVDHGQDRQQQREGDKYHLDPQQFGQQDFTGQRPREIGRHRRPRLAFIAPP
jgi:hypothetical protein